jgi:hypothetical protein
MKTLMTWMLLGLSLSLSACSGVSLQTPPRFLELEDDAAYDYRATTADGVVLALTAHEVDQDRGSTVSFWVEAIEARLRHTGGYALTEKKEVTTRAGLKGTQLRFGRDEAQKPYRYWVTVFVEGDSVFVIEAGGAEDVFTASAESIDAAIAAFAP